VVCDEDRIDYLVNFYNKSNRLSIIDFYCHCDRPSCKALIGTRASPGCELCKRERNMDLKTTDVLPTETVAHIQSAGCKAHKKSVIGAHNRC
jgi:hypothetical protein